MGYKGLYEGFTGNFKEIDSNYSETILPEGTLDGSLHDIYIGIIDGDVVLKKKKDFGDIIEVQRFPISQINKIDRYLIPYWDIVKGIMIRAFSYSIIFSIIFTFLLMSNKSLTIVENLSILFTFIALFFLFVVLVYFISGRLSNKLKANYVTLTDGKKIIFVTNPKNWKKISELLTANGYPINAT